MVWPDMIFGRSINESTTDTSTKNSASMFLNCFENLPISGRINEPSTGTKTIQNNKISFLIILLAPICSQRDTKIIQHYNIMI
jgi:hypothetical protein